MRLNKNTGFALILIGLGVVLVLKSIGIIITPLIGKIFSLILPIVMMYLGYIGMKHGRTFIGGVIFVVGFLILLGKLTWLIGLIFSIGLIIFGIAMLKNRAKVY